MPRKEERNRPEKKQPNKRPNRKVVPIDYKVGSQVLLRVSKRKAKFSEPWEGSSVVENKVQVSKARLQGHKHDFEHKDKLRK